MKKLTTKDLVLTAILTAIAIIIPLFVPIKIVLPPFSATFASHVPVMVAMYLGPLPAVFVALGSALGFLVQLGPIVALRAAMHVFFAVAGALMVKRRLNILAIGFATLLLHTLSDMLVVYLLFAFGVDLLNSQAMSAVLWTIGIGTSIHHIIDFAITLFVVYYLRKTNFLEGNAIL